MISEAIAKQPNQAVLNWLKIMDSQRLYLSVITIGEIKKGIEKLPRSHRRENIENWFKNDLFTRFSGRILEVDISVILTWGELVGKLEKEGRKLPAFDSLIAATAKYHNHTLVTRNEKDFAGIDIVVFNPFKGLNNE